MFKGMAIGAVLAAVLAAALIAPPAEATQPCPVQYCTDSSGEYVLVVPPLSPSDPIFGSFADCVWNAHVEFGDGTEADYVFDAAVGLTGSHVFPTPGVTYKVDVLLSEGRHGQTTDPCPNYAISTEVRYRTAAEEADDPAPAPPPPPPPPDEKWKTPPDAPATPVAGAADSQAQPDPGAPAAPSFWRTCRGSVYAHAVGCRKARRVARAAKARFRRPGTLQVGGFSCRLPRGPLQSIACRRGTQSVLGPGPDLSRP